KWGECNSNSFSPGFETVVIELFYQSDTLDIILKRDDFFIADTQCIYYRIFITRFYFGHAYIIYMVFHSRFIGKEIHTCNSFHIASIKESRSTGTEIYNHGMVDHGVDGVVCHIKYQLDVDPSVLRHAIV